MPTSSDILREPGRDHEGQPGVEKTSVRPAPRVAGPTLAVLLVLCVAVLALGVGSTHGSERLLVTVGEVTATTAVLWARSPEGGDLVAELTATTSTEPLRAIVRTSADRDHTGKTIVRELKPATRYRYRLNSGVENVTGSFVTAAADREARPVTFIWSGDLGGGGQCRRPGRGYPIFQAMARRQPDGPVDERDQQHEPRALRADEVAEPEHDESLVLGRDADGHR